MVLVVVVVVFSACFEASLSTRTRAQVPEAMGTVSSVVFLVIMFLFIPVPIFTNGRHASTYALARR